MNHTRDQVAMDNMMFLSSSLVLSSCVMMCVSCGERRTVAERDGRVIVEVLGSDGPRVTCASTIPRCVGHSELLST
jgi:hypothetical protein